MISNPDRTIVEFGPSIGTHNGRDIPAYLVTASGVRQEFDRIAVIHHDGLCPLDQLGPYECVISPGLIYREAQ